MRAFSFQRMDRDTRSRTVTDFPLDCLTVDFRRAALGTTGWLAPTRWCGGSLPRHRPEGANPVPAAPWSNPGYDEGCLRNDRRKALQYREFRRWSLTRHRRS